MACNATAAILRAITAVEYKIINVPAAIFPCSEYSIAIIICAIAQMDTTLTAVVFASCAQLIA